jgi:hypothetical protein
MKCDGWRGGRQRELKPPVTISVDIVFHDMQVFPSRFTNKEPNVLHHSAITNEDSGFVLQQKTCDKVSDGSG